MLGQRPVVDLVRAVVEGMEHLGIKQTYQEVIGIVIVRDNSVQGTFLLSQRVQIHIVVVRDGPDLGQVKGGQTHSGGHKDALGSLARRHLKDLILPDGDAVRLLPFNGAEQQIQRRDVVLVVLFYLRVFQHPHDHGKVLLGLRRLLKQHEDDGLQQRRFGLGPERIRLMAVLGCCGLNEVIDKPQGILLVPDIAEGVVSVRLLQIDKVQHPHIVALAFEVAAGGSQHLHFGIGDHIVGVGLQNVRQDIAAGLGRAAAADDQYVEGPAVLVGIQPQTDILCQGLILLLTEHSVDLFGRRPLCRAVFLAVTGAALCGAIQADAYDVRAGAGEDAHQAVFRPADLQRSLQGRGQVRQQLRQAVPEGLGNQESGPDHGDVEKQIREDPSRSARFIQRHSPPTEKQGRTALVRPIG